MLKKAGIALAATVAGLLAVSPLAFAGDSGTKHYGDQQKNALRVQEGDTVGLINVTGNEINVPVEVCNNDIPLNILGIQVSDLSADLTGALNLLGTSRFLDSGGENGDFRFCGSDVDSGARVTQSNVD